MGLCSSKIPAPSQDRTLLRQNGCVTAESVSGDFINTQTTTTQGSGMKHSKTARKKPKLLEDVANSCPQTTASLCFVCSIYLQESFGWVHVASLVPHFCVLAICGFVPSFRQWKFQKQSLFKLSPQSQVKSLKDFRHTFSLDLEYNRFRFQRLLAITKLFSTQLQSGRILARTFTRPVDDRPLSQRDKYLRVLHSPLLRLKPVRDVVQVFSAA